MREAIPTGVDVMSRPRKPTNAARFQIGDKLPVRHGVRDPDFPDIPLGGWAGTVTEVELAKAEVTYLITWDRATLRGMHPIYRKRCERDGLEFETMWLGEDDIEPDEGNPVAIEQPTSIVTKPLSEKDQDDRVRMALGLTHDDPLSEVSRKSLLAYHRYLTAHLSFPFPATTWDFGRLHDQLRSVTVHGLLNPEENGLDEEEGLIATGLGQDGPIEIPLAEVEIKRKAPNHRLVSDYAYWFHNWR
jgi:hypothetical protein